ncbi:MAG: ATP-binding cassette domain-containing protein, partial [Erysipelotrichaceae bacterium]|nr:ATP-binding cassette domain-containing protein [Erysipelotrichaceae bacterium]
MIELKHITKRYKKFPALIDFSYDFENGNAYGILGVNGAGKSTLINCITQNVLFDGELNYIDLSIWDIGYVPQELAIYPELLLMCDKEAIEVQKILPFLSDTWPLCRIGRAVIRASQSCRQSCNKS